MSWISGRTLSPTSGELVFTIDENANLPGPQNWEQMWEVCKGVPPIVDAAEPAAIWSYADEISKARAIRWSNDESELAGEHLHITETKARSFADMRSEDVDPMSNCTASQRTVTVSIVNFDVSDNGDAVLSSTGCIDRNCDTIGIYLKTRGKNPTRAILDNAFPNDILRAICWQESRWRHFASNGKPISHLNNDGTTDWGMMQINEATFEQQWNWKLNLARATDLLAEKHTQAVSYLNKHPKDVTPIMIENEMIQRYNFGPYYKWNPNTQTWEVSPPTNNNYLSLIRGFMNSKPW